MASRYHQLPVHSGSAPAQCLGSTAQGHKHNQRHACTCCEINTRLCSLIHCNVLTVCREGEKRTIESIYKESGGWGKAEGREEERNVEVREEVGYSVSDKILTHAHKRFNGSSPLITLSNTAEYVEVSTCVFVCVYRESERHRGEREQFTVALTIL